MTANHQTDLSAILQGRKMTGKALAHAIDATESQVSNYRRGLRPSPSRARQISEALGLSADEIDALGWDTEEAA
jgi:transcriptional regulator with XRE-family HTH domain